MRSAEQLRPLNELAGQPVEHGGVNLVEHAREVESGDVLLVDDDLTRCYPVANLGVKVGALGEELAVPGTDLIVSRSEKAAVRLYDVCVGGIAGDERLEIPAVVRVDLSIDELSRVVISASGVSVLSPHASRTDRRVTQPTTCGIRSFGYSLATGAQAASGSTGGRGRRIFRRLRIEQPPGIDALRNLDDTVLYDTDLDDNIFDGTILDIPTQSGLCGGEERVD